MGQLALQLETPMTPIPVRPHRQEMPIAFELGRKEGGRQLLLLISALMARTPT